MALGRWRDAWVELGAAIADYEPGAAILIARRIPRLNQLQSLGLPSSVAVMSDLAIPFAREALEGQRVAIVDDAINVGSTISRAARCALAAGAKEVMLFCIAQRPDAPPLDWPIVAAIESASEDDLRDLVRRVPDALTLLSKPFDLDLPVIPCRLVPPFRRFADVVAALRMRFGSEEVFDASQPTGASVGCHRATVGLTGLAPGLAKLRLYFDERSGTCNVVPIAIPSVLPASLEDAEETEWTGRMWSTLAPSSAPSSTFDFGEAFASPAELFGRVALFGNSLALGLRVVDGLRDVLVVSQRRAPFDEEDAALAFGPRITSEEAVSTKVDVPTRHAAASLGPTVVSLKASPFYRHVVNSEFMELVSVATISRDPLDLCAAITRTVAALVGATCPDDYRLDWPYPAAEVRRSPYLRLRVGPTFSDLVLIAQAVVGEHAHAAELARDISHALDVMIDQGAIVPTLATYDNHLYRIYRAGEAKPRDHAVERAVFALAAHGKPLSQTRFAKLVTILRYTDATDLGLKLTSFQRGTVLGLGAGILGDEIEELGQYLLSTGDIEREA